MTSPERGTIVVVRVREPFEDDVIQAGIVAHTDGEEPSTGRTKWRVLLQHSDPVTVYADECLVVDDERREELRELLRPPDITVTIRSEEIVIRESTVTVPAGTPNPRKEAERRFWDGEYTDSRDVDRRDETITMFRIGGDDPLERCKCGVWVEPYAPCGSPECHVPNEEDE